MRTTWPATWPLARGQPGRPGRSGHRRPGRRPGASTDVKAATPRPLFLRESPRILAERAKRATRSNNPFRAVTGVVALRSPWRRRPAQVAGDGHARVRAAVGGGFEGRVL